MLRLWVIFGLLSCVYVAVIGRGDMGPGMWHVIYIEKCHEGNYMMNFDVAQKKINRTHDGFNADLILNEDFTDEYAIRVEVCKHVDGGCKPCMVLTDESYIKFVNKYAEKNVKTILEMAGLDPPEFPIKKGEYHISDYIFDYNELPDNGAYGLYSSKVYAMKHYKDVGCVEVHSEFKEKHEEEDENDD